MKTILCYGDSNTHGVDPRGGPRFDQNTRWPGVLRKALGPDFWVIEEGCNGRTTVWDDPIEGAKNGAAYLSACLVSHQPIDVVVILLGTNDLKRRFNLGADDIARGASVLVDICQQSVTGPAGNAPEVLLLAPPPLAPLAQTSFAGMFAEAEEKSRELGEHYAAVAAERGCAFLNLAGIVECSRLDGIHLEADQHAILGRVLAERVQAMLGCPAETSLSQR